MKSAVDLQRHVLEELKWQPTLQEDAIGVSVGGNVVTLTGQVRSYTQRQAAEQTVRQVVGVGAVVNELFVKLPLSMQPADTEIARAAAHALGEVASLPDAAVSVSVQEGWVTLEGAVERASGRESAYRAIRDLRGILGVTNLITLQPRVRVGAMRKRRQAPPRRRLRAKSA